MKVRVGQSLVGIFIAFMACSNDEGGFSRRRRGIVSLGNRIGAFTASRDFDTIAAVKVAACSASVVVVQGIDNFGKGFQFRI